MIKSNKPRAYVSLSASFIAIMCVSLIVGCKGSGGEAKFTPVEKKAMLTKSEPPQAMHDAMSKVNAGKPNENVTSPWSKPQK